jgi:hypothetical protein
MNKKRKYKFTVNDKSAFTEDKTPNRTQILVEAGFEPADEYSLIKRTKHGTKMIPTDETLELEGDEEFFASNSRSTFELTVNCHSIVWCENYIDIAILRRVANVPEDFDVIFEREGAPDETLPIHCQFLFTEKGIEHLKTRKRQHQQFSFFGE